MKKRRNIIIFLLENIFYYTLIYFLFMSLMGQGEKFLQLNLHPLFILTGIMAYRYGVNLGVVSATIAMFVYIYSYIEVGRDIVVFFYDFKYYKFILMFFILSFILGRIKDNQDEKLHELSEEMSVIRKNYKNLYGKNNKLTYINNRMKGQIIKSEESIIALYNISNTLDTLNFEEVITNLIGIFKTYINAEAISLYTVDSSKKYLRLKVAVGENRKLPGSLKLDEYPEFLKAINEKKYGKRDGSNLKIPVFYAPILNNGEVIALLNIERLSYETYTDYTEKMFEILASWTNKAMSNALSYAEKIKDELYYEGTEIMYEKFLEKRISEERKRKEMFNLSNISLKFKVLTEDLKKIKLMKRSGDIAGYSEKEKVLYIIFSATPSEHKHLLKSKILDGNIGILEEYYEN